jgi:flagellar motor protein MotB
MPKHTWIIASVLSALVVFGLLGFSMWQQERQAAQLRATVEQSRSQIDALRANLANSKAQIEELQQEKEAATQAQRSLEQEMRTALESKDITISQLQGKLTVNILDRILFDSGEAVLKPGGENVLRKIASILAQFPNRQIHVIGHTDNVPIKASARSRFASNWELSTARATAAVRFLTEQAGVDPRRMGAVGYGEFHPIADNSTTEGRAKNRRIALVVLSEELAGSDAAPTAIAAAASPLEPTTVTNSLPSALASSAGVTGTILPSTPSTNAPAGGPLSDPGSGAAPKTAETNSP